MKTIFFTVADSNHLEMATNLKKSFEKYHPKIEFKIYTGKQVDKWVKQDPQFFYKQKPWIMRDLIRKYDLVVGMDADSIVTGELSYILEGDYEVGLVNNFNQSDARKYGAVSVFNIHPASYVNCGLVAVTSKQFVDLWWQICNRADFQTYQYREQDVLNLIIRFGNWLTTNFDNHAFYGIAAKDIWKEAIVKNDELVIEFSDDSGNVVLTRPIKVIHIGGGHNPNKMNMDLYFKEEAVKYIRKQYE